jgi:hypothetical protein
MTLVVDLKTIYIIFVRRKQELIFYCYASFIIKNMVVVTPGSVQMGF